MWLASGRNLLIASLSSYLLHFCIIINLIPTKETVLGKLIFERVAVHRLCNSVLFYSLFFLKPPSDHETTKEEPQESIRTDWQILSKYRIVDTSSARTQAETSAIFSLSFFFFPCFFCFIGKGTVYIDKIKWNYMFSSYRNFVGTETGRAFPFPVLIKSFLRWYKIMLHPWSPQHSCGLHFLYLTHWI